jgi:hypothetical protein
MRGSIDASIAFPAVSGIVECMNFNHGFSHHSCLFHVYYAETMEADQRTHGESKLKMTHGTSSRNK